MKISPSVRAAMVPDDNPMHPDYTSIYLVGPKGKQSLTIDSGEEIDRYRWFLKGYLAAIENEEIGLAAITHHHSDHSGNLKWAKQHLNAEIAIPLPICSAENPKVLKTIGLRYNTPPAPIAAHNRTFMINLRDNGIFSQ